MGTPPPLRALADRGERQASWLELFFDLVFVVAVSALAAQLHHDHSIAGLAVFAGLFVPVWWAWMGFTWYSAGFDTDDGAVRLGLLAGMVGVAVLATGVDGAAEEDSELFVLAYAGLLAILVTLYARAWQRDEEARPLTARYGIGDAAGALLWLASLAFAPEARPWVWAAAMVVLMSTPVVAVASLDRVAHDSRHIAERYGLFTLIVLGESVVVTVGGLDTGSSTAGVTVALLGFVDAATIWWVYFGRWRSMPGSNHPAGFVWAQGHFLVFAGIAAAAVGIEIAVEAAAHGEPLELADRLPLTGGLAAYLVAMGMIRGATRRVDWVVWLRIGAAAVLLAATLPDLEAVPFVALATALFVSEAAVEMTRAPAPPGGG